MIKIQSSTNIHFYYLKIFTPFSFLFPWAISRIMVQTGGSFHSFNSVTVVSELHFCTVLSFPNLRPHEELVTLILRPVLCFAQIP